MNPVLSELLRIYRPVAIWFTSLLVVGLSVAIAVIHHVTTPRFSPWSAVAGWAPRYWLAVIGLLMISLQLRQFVAAGVTRRAFLIGVAQFGLILAVAFAVVVTAGHGVERLVFDTGAYPAFRPGPEFVTLAVGGFAYFVSGFVIAAGFFRFGAFGGLALLVPGALPALVVEGLLGRGSYGELITRLMPWGAGAVVTLAVVGLAVLAGHRELRHVAIRPAFNG